MLPIYNAAIFKTDFLRFLFTNQFTANEGKAEAFITNAMKQIMFCCLMDILSDGLTLKTL